MDAASQAYSGKAEGSGASNATAATQASAMRRRRSEIEALIAGQKPAEEPP